MIILYPSNAIYVCTNTFGMSRVITSILFFTKITPVAMIASNAVVGLVASLHNMYARCVLPFAHVLDLMVSSLFLLNKLEFPSLFFFQILLKLIGSKKLSWSCCISLCAAAIPFSPNFVIPCFNLYVCRKLQA